MGTTTTGLGPGGADPRIRRHLQVGWWALLVFLTLGIALEAMHGFKIGYYLHLANSTRRLMWTLAHAHGTLLALVNIAFAATLQILAPAANARWPRLASAALIGATVLMPAGFFLGGLFIHAGDPGLGILLLPLGAALLVAAVLGIALGVRIGRR